MIHRRRLLLAAGLAVAGVPAATAMQPDRARPLVMLVGAPEGSEFDWTARVFAGFLGPRLGAPEPGGVAIDVRNMPGDGGHAMLAALGDATPSGATIGWVVTPTLLARAIDRNDPGLSRRLTIVGQVQREPIAFVSPASDPLDSVQDIIRRAGEDTDAVPLGTPPPGSPPHLAALRLQELAKIRLNIITFPSNAAARQAVLAGNVSAAALGLSSVIDAVRDGDLTAIGIAAKRRFGLLPETPVLDEAGIPLSAFIRRGLAVPVGTPGDVVAMLADAVRAVAREETFRRQAEAAGIYAAWADGPGWRAQMELEQAALARLWQTEPWRSSSSG